MSLSALFGVQLTNASVPIQDLMTKCQVRTFLHEVVKAVAFILSTHKTDLFLQQSEVTDLSPASKQVS